MRRPSLRSLICCILLLSVSGISVLGCSPERTKYITEVTTPPPPDEPYDPPKEPDEPPPPPPPDSGPVLFVTPTVLDLGEEAYYDYFTVKNLDGGNLSWDFVPDDLPSWIDFLWVDGSYDLGSQKYANVYVYVNRNKLDQGDYSHTLNITSNGGDASVEIKMTVPPPSIDLQVILTPASTPQPGYPVLYSDTSGVWSGNVMNDNGDGTYSHTYEKVQYPATHIMNIEVSPGDWAAVNSGTTASVSQLMANGTPLEIFQDNGLGGSNYKVELDSDGDVVCLNRTNDPLQYKQWYHHHIGMENAYPTEPSNVVVAVIDCGVDLAHPDLRGNLWSNPGEIPDNGIDDDGNGFVDDVHGCDFIDNDGDPTPSGSYWHPMDLTHGTAIAGQIAATANNSEGIAGVASCQIMAIRAFSGGGASIATIASSIHYAVDHGANVINMSFGTGYDIPQMRYAIEYAYQNGVTLVASAGNYGDDWSTFPAAYPEVIGVSALGRDDRITGFSSYGEYNSALCAPGVDVFTTWLYDGSEDFSVLYSKEGVNGTSFSAPLVAGGAARLLHVRPDLTPYDVRVLLVSTGDDLDAQHPNLEVYDLGPRLNLRAALDAAPGYTPTSSANLAATYTVRPRSSDEPNLCRLHYYPR